MHDAAQFERVQPEKFEDDAEWQGQAPVRGDKAGNESQADGAVNKADYTRRSRRTSQGKKKA